MLGVAVLARVAIAGKVDGRPLATKPGDGHVAAIFVAP
jgi:hypothetical protein